MAYSHGNNTPPLKLSATFTPGNEDNYHMPVISPIPQRSMPEVPEQMQQNLSRLELNPPHMSAAPSISGYVDNMNTYGYGQPQNGGNEHGQYPAQEGLAQPRKQLPTASPGASPRISPRVSPNPRPRTGSSMPGPSILAAEPFFPYVKNRPPNVPARAEETERILEGARHAVLSSNDPEMQLTWAQDTLAYIDTSIENNGRLVEAGFGRPQTPTIERNLRTDAYNIVSFLADQHHPRAEFLRGTWLEFGKFGCPVDKPGAYRCFSTSARNGYARAEYRIGMQFEETEEIEKALQHYNKGIQLHDAACSYRLGMMYLLGQKGQPLDIRLGLDYIRYSAENADDNTPQGAYVYGMLLARELTQVTVPDQALPKDLVKAKYYLEKAAYLGFSKAQTRLASAYESQNLNCDYDPVYSLHYNQLAARQGEAEAEMAISKWFLSGCEGIFPKNEAVAYEYALRAAKSGFAMAEFAMGYFYEVGIHVQSNLIDAKYWYGLSAEHGNPEARGRITSISRSKTLSRKDHDNMALAKIKSLRGRPTAAQQQASLSMPQIDAYRQPSPAPGPANGTVYGRDYYQNQHPGQPGRPTPTPNNSDNNGDSLRPQPLRPTHGQPPAVSPSPSAPYSARQSSLPQGYRVSSQGLPPNSAGGRPYLNVSNTSTPSSSPSLGGFSPIQPSFPVDIGYSAPVDVAGADRRRIASGPGALGNNASGPRPDGSVLARKPASNNQATNPYPRPVKTEALQAQPRPKPLANLAHSPAPTPPPKSTAAPGEPAKRPGKGPATFAEMGIPAQKKKDDCIVM